MKTERATLDYAASYLDDHSLPERMGLKYDLANGIISLVIGVAITKLTASDDGGRYDTSDVLKSVAVASFFSGFFTSYFAK